MDQLRKSDDFTKEVVALADEYLDSEILKIFVMGPDTGSKKKGAKVRREIIRLCNEEGLAVKAEHPQIIAAVKKRFRQGFTLTHLEALMAEKSDLIIIIPDSAGSIAELGYFALRENICTRMVILFEKRYLHQKNSYIAQGPRRAAKNSGATVLFVDYLDPMKIWKKILPRIAVTRASKVKGRLERRRNH